MRGDAWRKDSAPNAAWSAMSAAAPPADRDHERRLSNLALERIAVGDHICSAVTTWIWRWRRCRARARQTARRPAAARAGPRLPARQGTRPPWRRSRSLGRGEAARRHARGRGHARPGRSAAGRRSSTCRRRRARRAARRVASASWACPTRTIFPGDHVPPRRGPRGLAPADPRAVQRRRDEGGQAQAASSSSCARWTGHEVGVLGGRGSISRSRSAPRTTARSPREGGCNRGARRARTTSGSRARCGDRGFGLAAPAARRRPRGVPKRSSCRRRARPRGRRAAAPPDRPGGVLIDADSDGLVELDPVEELVAAR